MTEIPISGAVIRWAREFRGLSLDEAAKRLDLPRTELEAYETERRKPSLTKFEKIAASYRLPLATLFRRTPPEEPKKPSDFRTFEGMATNESFEFRVALSNVRTLQATLRVLLSEDENFQRPTIRRYDFHGEPLEQGEAERREIGVSVQWQLSWGAGEGFRRWRAVIERLGIAVYFQKFDLADCRGFSLWEEGITPAIVINKAERSENARVFTLIHEYAHLLIRRPGISDLNSTDPTEAFCNRFAAAFLMPVAALQQLLPVWPNGRIDWDDETVRPVAARLMVSAQALAIRLEELGRAERGLSRRFVAYIAPKKQLDGGGNYVNTRLSELGARYTASVIGALDREVIDSVHASEVLGLGAAHLRAARAYVERQRELASAG